VSRARRLGAVAALVVAAGCTPGDEPAPVTPVPGGTVVFGVLGAPSTLDPYSARATDLTYAIARPLYPSLYRFMPGGKPVPYLADSLDPIPGGVRVGLKEWLWSDGRRVTSADVVASVRRARPPSGLAPLDATRAGARAVNLIGRRRDWERTLATVAFVLPSGRAGEVSGGPFVVASYRPGLEAVLEPNPRWPEPGPYLDRIRVQFVSALGILIELVKAGRMDAALVPTTVNLDDRLDSARISSAAVLGWESVGLDFRDASLGRPERAALAGALDRRALDLGLVRAAGRVSNTLHPGPGGAGTAPGPFRRPRRGRPPRTPVVLVAPSGDELLQPVVRVAQTQLAGAGIDAQIALAEPNRDRPPGVVVYRSAGIPGTPDPPRAARTLLRFPLFHVETVVASPHALEGVEVNPTVEGPLWNAERWWWNR
jgi:hypothetical protein